MLVKKLLGFLFSEKYQLKLNWLQLNYFLRASPVDNTHLLNNIHLKNTVTMTSDSKSSATLCNILDDLLSNNTDEEIKIILSQ